MWNYLRSLQQKPLHERKIATYVLTVILFAVIVFLWIMFLNVEKARESNSSSLEGILSPFQSVKDIFTGIFDGTEIVEFPGLEGLTPEDFVGGENLMQGEEMATQGVGTTTGNMATTTIGTTSPHTE